MRRFRCVPKNNVFTVAFVHRTNDISVRFSHLTVTLANRFIFSNLDVSLWFRGFAHVFLLPKKNVSYYFFTVSDSVLSWLTLGWLEWAIFRKWKTFVEKIGSVLRCCVSLSFSVFHDKVSSHFHHFTFLAFCCFFFFFVDRMSSAASRLSFAKCKVGFSRSSVKWTDNRRFRFCIVSQINVVFFWSLIFIRNSLSVENIFFFVCFYKNRSR